MTVNQKHDSTASILTPFLTDSTEIILQTIQFVWLNYDSTFIISRMFASVYFYIFTSWPRVKFGAQLFAVKMEEQHNKLWSYEKCWNNLMTNVCSCAVLN